MKMMDKEKGLKDLVYEGRLLEEAIGKLEELKTTVVELEAKGYEVETIDEANALVKIHLLILNDKWNRYWDSKLAA